MNLNLKHEHLDLGFPNPQIGENPTLYIGKVVLGDDEVNKLNLSTKRDLFIFGAVVKTGEVHFQYGELKRLELIVVEHNLDTNMISQRHLAQFNNSIFWKVDGEETLGEAADMVKKKDIPCLKNPPRWKASEASIPTKDSKLFCFAQQIYAPENKTSKEFGIFRETLYIFLYGEVDDRLLVQIFLQDTSAQTAEDHYKLEGWIADFEKYYKNLETVEELIKQGDKFFHEYILASKKRNQHILKILLKYAKTKAMKSQIEKQLK